MELQQPAPAQDVTDYLKALIDNLRSQRNHILLFASFSVAAIAALINKVVFPEPTFWLSPTERLLLSISFVGFCTSAACYARWLVHLTRLEIQAIDLLLTQDIVEVRKTHHPGNVFWLRHRWVLLVGNSAIYAAIGAAALVGVTRLLLGTTH